MKSNCFVVCAGLALAVAASAAHGAVITVYSNSPGSGDSFTNPGGPPTNASAPIGGSGWSYSNVRVGGTIGINDTNPRSGNGSVFMNSADGSAKSDIEYRGVLGTLGSLTSLSYEYYRDGSSTATAHLHPSLRLLYDADGNLNTTNDQGALIYEQIYNEGLAAVPTNTWVSANVIGANFWMTNTGNPNGSILEIYDRTLNEWATTANPNPAYPTLSASTVIYGISSGFGSGWSGTFTGAIDNITIGFSNQREPTTYNFEVAAVPEPATLALWSVLAATAGVTQFRRRRK